MVAEKAVAKGARSKEKAMEHRKELPLAFESATARAVTMELRMGKAWGRPWALA